MSLTEYTKPASASLNAPIWTQNPVLTQLLGLSPLLAVSSTATKGFSLGILSALLCLSAVIINRLLHSYIRPAWRFVWYLFLLATLTTVIDLALQLTLLPLYLELGYYLPLMACNFAILVHLETKNNELNNTANRSYLLSTLSYCLGLFLAMALFSCLRELLIFGSIFKDWSELILTASDSTNNAAYSSSMQAVSFAFLQPGAFILLGLLLAAKQLIDSHLDLQGQQPNQEIKKVKRARVTGKI